MKGLKFIPILLLISIGILIGHNLVPHHHHVAMINHPSSQECPASNHEHPGNQKHHDGDHGAKHCHAFNDIHFVKYNTSQLPVPVDISSLMISVDPSQVKETQSSITFTFQAGKIPGVLPAEYSGKLTLRGPPMLS